MTNLDSIKIQLPNDCLLSLGDRFNHTQSIDNKGRELQNKSTLTTTGLLGFKGVIVDNQKGVSTFEFSAKILGENYPQGINLNTITQVAENINNSKQLTVDVNRFIENAEVLRLDVTDNIRPEVTSEILYSSLALIPVNKKYHVDHYNTKTNLGVVFKGNQKTVRDRLILYDKVKDLLRDKELRKQPYAIKVFNAFKDVVRVESNHSKFKDLKQLYGSRNLLDILGSDVKVNHKRFTSITNKSTDIKLFTQFEGMKWSEIVKYEGFKGICELCSMDWRLIDMFIRVHNPHNYRRGIREELKAFYNSLNHNAKTVDINLIEHIKQLLLVA